MLSQSQARLLKHSLGLLHKIVCIWYSPLLPNYKTHKNCFLIQPPVFHGRYHKRCLGMYRLIFINYFNQMNVSPEHFDIVIYPSKYWYLLSGKTLRKISWIMLPTVISNSLLHFGSSCPHWLQHSWCLTAWNTNQGEAYFSVMYTITINLWEGHESAHFLSHFSSPAASGHKISPWRCFHKFSRIWVPV